jgi:hypothetical protein
MPTIIGLELKTEIGYVVICINVVVLSMECEEAIVEYLSSYRVIMSSLTIMRIRISRCGI